MQSQLSAIGHTRVAKNPLLEIRLSGSQAQMGAQYGEILAAEGGYHEMLEFYPRMAESMILGGIPRAARKGPARHLATQLMSWATNTLAKNEHPEHAARTHAMLRAANVSPQIARNMLVMDVFQNSIGVLGRLGALHVFDRPVLHAIPACTSAVVYGSMSADGELLHARNFDFPGVGIWDKSPTIVYCTPDKGIPYGYIGARGADVPGITAFNAEGISLTFHTRFHREVDFNATGVIDLGHEIIRRARTIADAIDIVAHSKIASTWGIMVTSAKENSAAVIETTARKFRVTWSKDDHHAQTNHYLHPDMQSGEIATSGAWTTYTVDRMRLMDKFFVAMRAKGGATLTDMQNLLGSDFEADNFDEKFGSDWKPSQGTATSRVMGSLIGHVLSVQSVVFKLKSGLISLSVGQAPTGWGPYIDHELDWSGDRLKKVDLAKTPMTTPSAHYTQGKFADAYSHFQSGYLKDFNGSSVGEVLQDIKAAVAAAPQDPSLRFVAGTLALEAGDIAGAHSYFHAAAEAEQSPYRKGQALLWASRAAAALDRPSEAADLRRQLLALQHHNIGDIVGQANKDRNRLLPRRRFNSIVSNLAVMDAA
jgi:hypothetical protein